MPDLLLFTAPRDLAADLTAQEMRELARPDLWGSPAERAERGANYLDRVVPGWFDVIDLDRLNLRSSCQCVLGQLFDVERAVLAFGSPVGAPDAGFGRALDALGLNYNVGGATEYLGFDLEFDSLVGYEELQTAWRELIEARRDG